MDFNAVSNLIKENDVVFADLRFTDTKGKEQHITLPISCINEKFFDQGKMFDGSSIAGWCGIDKSDMILMPDINTVQLDPFYADPTIIVRCDILETETLTGYSRDPRSVAKRAEEYKSQPGSVMFHTLVQNQSSSCLMMFVSSLILQALLWLLMTLRQHGTAQLNTKVETKVIVQV